MVEYRIEELLDDECSAIELIVGPLDRVSNHYPGYGKHANAVNAGQTLRSSFGKQSL